MREAINDRSESCFFFSLQLFQCLFTVTLMPGNISPKSKKQKLKLNKKYLFQLGWERKVFNFFFCDKKDKKAFLLFVSWQNVIACKSPKFSF